jgi:hypothetical protein
LRLTFRLTFVLVAALAFIVEASCSDDGALRDLGPRGDGGAAQIPRDARAGDSEASGLTSTMRVAHLAPAIGPIDFCYQGARKGTFVGPVLGGGAAPKADDADADADANADLDASLPSDVSETDGGSLRSATYRTVTAYLALATAGPVTIAVVEAGATSCAKALATADVTLDPGKLSTVGLFEKRVDGGISVELAAFTDDRTTDPEALRVRVIHAALGNADVPAAGPLAIRAVAAKTTVLGDRVEPRNASTASQAVMVDALGYVTAPPIPPPTSIAIGPATTDGGADAGFDPWQSKSTDLDLRGGSLHTAFILTGATEATFEVLWCADTTTAGAQTSCTLVP